MILGTSSVLVPPAHAQVRPIGVTPTTGGPGTTVSVAPTINIAPGTFTPLHAVTALFDTGVADADEGQALAAFLAGPAPIPFEEYVDLDANGAYTTGEPIYALAATGVVAVGDTRLTAVTVSTATGYTVYAAGSVVALGDFDVATATTAFAAAEMYVDASANGAYSVGEHIYLDNDGSGLAVPPIGVTPGDTRLNYPNTRVANVAGAFTYGLNTLVRANVFDYQEGLYQDLDGSGTVSAGDLRSRQYVAPNVVYAPGPVVAGDVELASGAGGAFVTTPFPATTLYVDANGNGRYDYGELIYEDNDASATVTVGDARWSYVTVGAALYIPTDPTGTAPLVGANDADLNTPLAGFATATAPPAPPGEEFFDLHGVGTYSYPDPIYRVATSLVIAAGDTRLSDFRLSDWWAFSATATTSWAWAAGSNFDATQAQPFIAGIAVAANDGDAGIALRVIPANMMYTDFAVNGYTPEDPIYLDNDGSGSVTVGDTRLTVVDTLLVPYPPAALPVNVPGPWYMQGSTVAAGDTDALWPVPTPLWAFGTFLTDPLSFADNILPDKAYSTEIMASTYGLTDPAGLMGQLPMLAALTAHVPMTFTIPAGTPSGNHAIFLAIDDTPSPGYVAPWNNIGFLQNTGATTYPLAASSRKNDMDPLPWGTGSSLPPIGNSFTWPVMGTQAGPAFFVIPKVCAVQMSPGAYAHTLGTPAGIVELDYNKGSVVQNSTGDISLNVTLCGDASTISIYIPPEFTFLQPDTTSVWTSITNDYSRIALDTRGSGDPIGPSWWNLRIVNSTISIGNHVVRMFNLRAPEVCGRYFVKVFIDGESIGAENFPTIVVKGDLYPAYISGRVLNGGLAGYVPVTVPGKVVAEGTTATGKAITAQAYFNASMSGAYVIYGLPAGTYSLTASAAGFVPTTLNETVSVHAGQSLHGVDIYVEPSATISGSVCSKCGAGSIPWGSAHSRPISMEILDSNLQSKAWLATNTTTFDPSQAYYPFSFNGSIELDGHVPQDHAAYVSGLAPGDYYLKAYVNGCLQKDIVAVHVYEHSRSLSVIFDLWRSSQFSVTVHFVDVTGSASPTPKNGTLTLEAYGLDGGIEGWNRTSVPEGSINWTMMILGKNYGLPSGTYFIKASFPGYSQAIFPEATLGEGCSTTSLSFNMVRGGALYLTLRSVNSQTPPQNVAWEYPNATIRIEAIGSEQVYSGTARQENAAVGSQTLVGITFANITDLPPDTYLIRAYTVGYIQVRDYQVSMSFGSMSDIQIDLVKATKLQVTLTFRTEGLVAAPGDAYARYSSTQVPARIEVYDSLGLLVGANATHIPAGESSSIIEVVGFRNYAGDPCLRWVNYYDATDGELQKDYGLPSGTYQVLAWVPGYAQAQTATFSTTPESTAGIALYFDREARVYGYVGGLDMYDDLIPLSWATVTAYGPILMATSSLDGFYEMWIVNGTYTLGVSYPGYEAQGVEIQVSMAWETPVDFNLTPTGSTTPELSATEWMSAAMLVIACASLRRRPPAS